MFTELGEYLQQVIMIRRRIAVYTIQLRRAARCISKIKIVSLLGLDWISQSTLSHAVLILISPLSAQQKARTIWHINLRGFMKTTRFSEHQIDSEVKLGDVVVPINLIYRTSGITQVK